MNTQRLRTRAQLLQAQDESAPLKGAPEPQGRGKRRASTSPEHTEPLRAKRRALGDVGNREPVPVPALLKPTASRCIPTPPQQRSTKAYDSQETSSASSLSSNEAHPMSEVSDSMLDIDRAVARDPLYVAEYASDIYRYLRELEVSTRPRSNYMSKQKDATPDMRAILVDWLVEVAEEYKLRPESLFLSVHYTDRFLSKMAVTRSKLQLVGVTAMYIASKYEEIYAPPPNEFIYISDNTYKPEQLFKMEQLMLRALDFRMGTGTSRTFAERYLRAVRARDAQLDNLVWFLLELCLQDYGLLVHLPSVVAASVVCLALHTLGRPCWSQQLAECTQYEPSDIRLCTSAVYEIFVQSATSAGQKAVKAKYAHTKYLKAACTPAPTEPPCVCRDLAPCKDSP